MEHVLNVRQVREPEVLRSIQIIRRYHDQFIAVMRDKSRLYESYVPADGGILD